MNVTTIAGLLRERAQLRTHDGWTRDEVLAYRSHRLADLRAYAMARSPFYRDLHRGLAEAPLSALPVVTKATLRAGCFNARVTDAQHWAQVRRGQTRRKPRLRRIGRAYFV